MRRLHAIELHELAGCPALFRNYATDYLETAIRLGDAYGPAAPLLAEALAQTGSDRVLDLCSGGGGPWSVLRQRLAEAGHPVRVALSDLFPNQAGLDRVRRLDPAIHVEPGPVNALRVPSEARGLRTMFSAFHHFRPAEAKGILADAVARREAIAIFEATERAPATLLPMLLLPLIVWLFTPAIRPFSWGRLFWTYLVPIVPLMVAFDGLVSALRTYSAEELGAFAAEVGGDYRWRSGMVRGPKGLPMTYLIGVPPARS